MSCHFKYYIIHINVYFILLNLTWLEQRDSFIIYYNLKTKSIFVKYLRFYDSYRYINLSRYRMAGWTPCTHKADCVVGAKLSTSITQYQCCSKLASIRNRAWMSVSGVVHVMQSWMMINGSCWTVRGWNTAVVEDVDDSLSVWRLQLLRLFFPLADALERPFQRNLNQ